MGLYKRGKKYWICQTYNGQKIRRSTGLSDKRLAEQHYNKFMAETVKLGRFPDRPIFSREKTILVNWALKEENERLKTQLARAMERNQLRETALKAKIRDLEETFIEYTKATQKLIERRL